MNIKQERIRNLTPSLTAPVGEGAVVYWVNRDRRLHDNWALLYAQKVALERRVPLHVVFCLVPHYLGATSRAFDFMHAGLEVLAQDCADHNIGYHLLHGDPPTVLPQWLDTQNASLLVTDFEPLRIKMQWLNSIISGSRIPVHQVDAHNIVPCWHVSQKQEFAAYTIRPKINRLLPEFLEEFPRVERHPWGPSTPLGGTACRAHTTDTNRRAHTLGPSTPLGVTIAQYVHRNDPTKNGQSGLSPYFHFGLIAPQRVALEVSALPRTGGEDDPVASFLEELIIRRELSDNFTFYNDRYDSFEGFPAWAQQSLNEHRNDPRQYIYSYEEWEGARTHDPLWNAAQQEMLVTGRMHGYMRMYWAKKLLEWSASPEEALAIGIALNDTYELDGRDPNGYAGLAWSIGGVHDRAWFDRPVYGKVRYMNANGCAKKFDVKEYIRRYANPKLL